MTPTTYQKPEIRDANDNIIQQGAFGKNTALANATNDGWIDYVANDLEFLYDLAKDEIVPVPSLPASGQMNKTYLLTTTGVSYRWSGTQWVAVSSSEAVGRAETAATNAQNYANAAQQSADDAQDTADDISEHLAQIDRNTGGVSKNSKRISNVEKLLQGNLYDYDTDDTEAYVKDVPAGALPYAGIEKIGGKTVVMNQLVNSGTTSVTTISGHKYYTLIDGTASIVTSSGGAIAIVDDTADMVTDLTLMFGAGNEPTTVEEFKAMFPASYYPYNAGILLSAGATEVVSNHANLINASALEQGSITIVNGNETPSNARVRTPYIDVKPNTTYRISVGGTVQAYTRCEWKADGTYIYYYSISSQNSIFTTGNDTGKIRIIFRVADDSNITPSDVVNPVLTLEPITLATYPIPAEVQALEGYGWSAGSVYNYIDYERKVFVKNVVGVDMGALNWNYVKSSIGEYFSVTLNDKKNGLAQAICSKYMIYGLGIATITEATGIAQSTNQPKIVCIVEPKYTNAADFKSAMSGVYLYYELATPIETDISQYLTDNLVEVDADGTLTFENSNGDDYHIPVPSDVTYMINLQEAIENGN